MSPSAPVVRDRGTRVGCEAQTQAQRDLLVADGIGSEGLGLLHCGEGEDLQPVGTMDTVGGDTPWGCAEWPQPAPSRVPSYPGPRCATRSPTPVNPPAVRPTVLCITTASKPRKGGESIISSPGDAMAHPGYRRVCNGGLARVGSRSRSRSRGSEKDANQKPVGNLGRPSRFQKKKQPRRKRGRCGPTPTRVPPTHGPGLGGLAVW